jgi:hypothetical protein
MGKIINRMRERAEEAETRRWLASDECPSFLRPLPFPKNTDGTIMFKRRLPFGADGASGGAGGNVVDTRAYPASST